MLFSKNIKNVKSFYVIYYIIFACNYTKLFHLKCSRVYINYFYQ
jgi:hypothetical protein